jgi:hypothetical protein
MPLAMQAQVLSTQFPVQQGSELQSPPTATQHCW